MIDSCFEYLTEITKKCFESQNNRNNGSNCMIGSKGTIIHVELQTMTYLQAEFQSCVYGSPCTQVLGDMFYVLRGSDWYECLILCVFRLFL